MTAPLGMIKIHAAGAGMLFLVLGGVLVLVVKPRLEAGTQAREAERTLASLRADSETSLAQARAAEAAATRVQKELEAQPVTLGPASRLNERVGAVSARAESLGLKVLELVPGLEQPGANHVKFPIRLRAAGPADAGPRLLRQLHGEFPDLSVVAVKLNANPADSAEQGQRAQAQVAIDFEWYAERDAPRAK